MPPKQATPSASTVGTSAQHSAPPNPSVGNNNQDDDDDVSLPDIPTPQIKVDAVDSLKIKLPDIFSGNRKDLESFLL
jgi:hypothetical protein